MTTKLEKRVRKPRNIALWQFHPESAWVINAKTGYYIRNSERIREVGEWFVRVADYMDYRYQQTTKPKKKPKKKKGGRGK